MPERSIILVVAAIFLMFTLVADSQVRVFHMAISPECMPHIGRQAASNPAYHYLDVSYHLKRGERLIVFSSGSQRGHTHFYWLNNHDATITTLNDLRGAVSIHSLCQALCYARSFATADT